MRHLKYIIPFSALVLLFSCSATNSETADTLESPKQDKPDKDLSEYHTAYFASGCFWCVEAVFESVKGVEEAVSGYAGGTSKNPTYKEVSAGKTDHAESVKVYYDSSKVDFPTLVKVFFGSQDPTTPNQQGPDRGSQYRSIAFYSNSAEKQIIENYIKKLEKDEVFDDPIVTIVQKIGTFWKAEDYHQDYEKNNPGNPYVQNVSIPRLNKFKKKFPELLKDEAKLEH